VINLTKPQREALKEVYDRGPLVWDRAHEFLVTPPDNYTGIHLPIESLEQALQPLMCGDGCVLLPWQGMWLGIEKDGYVHS
jgi:hypothetical protein